MGIDFTNERWEKVRQTYAQWWDGSLKRPVIPVELLGRPPDRPQPPAPLLTQETCADFRWSAEELVDRIDWELSQRVYLGDAFPYFNMDCFGPGVAAAFAGARLDNSSGRVWFWPPEDRPIQEIHLEYNPDNVWLKRVKDICAAAMQRWQGMVLVGMTDLGGNLDVPATFTTTEKLLVELYDHPEEVERLTWEAHAVWHRFYADINAVLQPVNPGYSDWSAIFSDRPSYMLQCDFSYMISTRMFNRFVKPELTETCRKLGRSFYHLDGVGQIPHLDALLSIPELDGVQWIPGDGKPDCSQWPELFQKINAAGKKIQVTYGGLAAVEAVAAQTANPGAITCSRVWGHVDDSQELQERLAEFGLEAA